MSLFPMPPNPNEDGFNVSAIWKTVHTQSDAMTEQSKQKALFAVYDVSFKYDHLTVAEMQTLWTFYMARKGSFERFNIYDIYSAVHAGLFVGWGDGVTTTFDLPGKTTSSQGIYIDGILQTSGYSILSGGGVDSSDRVQFGSGSGGSLLLETGGHLLLEGGGEMLLEGSTPGSPPTLGRLITCDFTGYLRMRVRFEKDKHSRESFANMIFRDGLDLKGVSAEGL